MNRLVVACILVILLAGGVVFIWQTRAPEFPSYTIPMQNGETVVTWDFLGAYAGNVELLAKADADIKRLTELLGTKGHSDYLLYVSIANQYDLKGDGKNELAYLEKALSIDSANTGLAWYNAGQFFKRLGAYATARYALERAVAAQPVDQYQNALADLLSERFPDEVLRTAR